MMESGSGLGWRPQAGNPFLGVAVETQAGAGQWVLSGQQRNRAKSGHGVGKGRRKQQGWGWQ